MRLPTFLAAGTLLLVGCSAADEAGRGAVESPLPAVLASLMSEHGVGPEAVARCMRAAGFEYVATLQPSDPEAGGRRVGEVAFAEAAVSIARQEGYGVVLGMTSNTQPAPSADNPNEVIFRSLSPAEQKAYIEARDGANRAPHLGCIDLDRADEREYEHSLASEGMDELLQRALAAGDVQAATRQWTRCMSDAGFGGLGDRGAAFARAMELVSDVLGVAVEHDGESATVALNDDEPIAEEIVSEALAVERALATADASCFLDVVLPAVRESVERINSEQQLASPEAVRLLFGDPDTGEQ